MLFGEGRAHTFTLQILEVLLKLNKVALQSGGGSKNCQVLCVISAAWAGNTLISLAELAKALESQTGALWWGRWNTGIGCPENLWCLHPWRFSKDICMWSWATDSSWPYLGKGWTRSSPDVPSYHSPSVSLMKVAFHHPSSWLEMASSRLSPEWGHYMGPEVLRHSRSALSSVQ